MVVMSFCLDVPRTEETPLPRERCQKLEEEDVHSSGFVSTNPETRSDAGDLRGAVPGLVVCGRKISTGVGQRPVSIAAVAAAESRRGKSTQIETDGEKLKARRREWLRYQSTGKRREGTIVMAGCK